jgi:hypothetical protein
MGIASFEVSTNTPIEFQSGGDEATLIANAVGWGYAVENVEVRPMEDMATFVALIPVIPIPDSATQARLKSDDCSIEDIKAYLIERDKLA